MQAHISELYKDAPRFDEGDIRQSKEYSRIKSEQFRLRDLMADTFGPSVVPLLDDYTGTLFEEMECEAQHFFQEGYLAAKRESGVSPAL